MKQRTIFFATLAIIAATEGFSVAGFAWPILTTVACGLVLVAVLLLCARSITAGFICLLVELIIGSQGYLLYIEIGNDRIPLRIGLWIIVMAMWLVQSRREIISYIKKSPYVWPLGFLILSIIIAAVNGYLKNNELSLIMTEAKRWSYLITLVPLLAIFRKNEARKLLWPALMAAGAWIAFKTFVILYIFSHDFGISHYIYSWTRNNLLGEITTLPNGFSRVFLQSQIFAVAGFFISLGLLIKSLYDAHWKLRRVHYVHGAAASIFLAVIITSLSRSFWMGTAVAVVVGCLSAIIVLKPRWITLGKSALALIGVTVASLVILGIVIVIPFPKPLWALDASILSDRATEFEAGAASRWALLPVMIQSIKHEPILSQGLGATLTYLTSDPRIRLTTVNGSYTTNAFEWGWFDIWLKLGLIGLAAYGWLLIKAAKRAFSGFIEAPDMLLAAWASLVALIIIHFFTPYLNHPLGFGYLATILLLIEGPRLDLD